jgi:predicted DNA-binding mobile mystery protein A
MSVKKIVTKQYRDIVNRAAHQLDGLIVPQEGWLRTVRNALNMSGAQLARRMSVTRALISNTEKTELSGGVTLKSMQQMAEAMNCRFIYAIVPEHDIEDVVAARARAKATEQVKATTTHMALEDQALSGEQMEFEIDRLAKDMIEKMDSKLWNDG